jgi:serine/threonine protein kinase
VSGFAPGRRLHHRFTLVERIGAGGMSEVWRATDEVLDRPVAVKVLTSPPAGAERLTWREARAAARLTHPNVTRVYDYGELSLPGGDPAGYLVMELVDGQSLAARLSAGPVPWPEAVRIVRQVASALAAAHRLGVVHRDIKPGNVMLAGEAGDTVKVLDFGIAAVAGADTDPGRLLGTPRYAAPERSDTTAPARPESDVYSLGVLLHEALAGHPPDRSPP